MFHSGTLLRTITRDSLSDISEELLQQGNGRARIHRSFCWKKQKPEQTYIAKHQKITANHKKSRHLSFSTFNIYVLVLVSQSCLILCNPMDCSLPGSSVHGILQTRILEYSLLRGIFPNQETEPRFPTSQADPLRSEPPGKPFIVWEEAHWSYFFGIHLN